MTRAALLGFGLKGESDTPRALYLKGKDLLTLKETDSMVTEKALAKEIRREEYNSREPRKGTIWKRTLMMKAREKKRKTIKKIIC